MRTRILLVFGLAFLALALGGVILLATGASLERTAASGDKGFPLSRSFLTEELRAYPVGGSARPMLREDGYARV